MDESTISSQDQSQDQPKPGSTFKKLAAVVAASTAIGAGVASQLPNRVRTGADRFTDSSEVAQPTPMAEGDSLPAGQAAGGTEYSNTPTTAQQDYEGTGGTESPPALDAPNGESTVTPPVESPVPNLPGETTSSDNGVPTVSVPGQSEYGPNTGGVSAPLSTYSQPQSSEGGVESYGPTNVNPSGAPVEGPPAEYVGGSAAPPPPPQEVVGGN